MLSFFNIGEKLILLFLVPITILIVYVVLKEIHLIIMNEVNKDYKD